MTNRQRLGVIFGGQSVEHEVSVHSAQAVLRAADPSLYEVVPIGVTKQGGWLTLEETRHALDIADPPFKKTLGGAGHGLVAAAEALSQVDVVFPLVHGTHGEDGTLQGLLELAGLPYVGCGVAASALGMDKALMKACFSAAGLPVADHVVVRADAVEDIEAVRDIEARIGYPAFVKPSNGGSSVGVSKARNREDLSIAIAEAGSIDRKIIVEKFIEGREVECGVLGNPGDTHASPVGEVLYDADFYDYEAKYLDSKTVNKAPADLTADVVTRVQELALKAFSALDCSGMSRVDFFLKPDGDLVLVEINTIPGFSPTSMYPVLWQASGISYSELITRLVSLAVSRRDKE
jgi:D-alanine-D-alanine ligase